MIQDSVGKKVTPDLIKQLYQEELGRLPEEGAVGFYQDLYGDTFDQRELDQFRGSTEAQAFESDVEKQAKVAESRPGLENLYQDILFREADPTGIAGFAGRPLEEVRQEITTSPEAMGPARTRQAFEEVVKRPARPEDMAFYQERFGPVVSNQERAELVRAMRPEQMQMFQRELGIPTLDFSKFGTTPERAGISRLMPAETEEAAAEEGMRTGGVVDQNGIPRLFIGGLFKKVKNLVKPIFKIGKKIAPSIIAMSNPALGATLAAAEAGVKDGKIDFGDAALAGIKTLALAKAGETIAGGPETGAVDVGIKKLDPSTFPFGPGYTSAAIPTAPTVGQQLAQPFTDPKGFGRDFMSSAGALGKGLKETGSEILGGDFSGLKGLATPLSIAGITQTAEMGLDEAENIRNKQRAVLAAQEEKRKKYRDLASSLRSQFPYGYKKGGISSLPARYLDGEGDGMSDSIKANIGGLQEARLADGEFVVPADVVADLGNGSSNAGAERLYSMMDRIRQARHGTTKQPPEVNVNKALPA